MRLKRVFYSGEMIFLFSFFFFLCNPIFVQRFEPRFRFISLRSGYLNSLYRSTVWLDARMNFLRVGAIEISPSSLTTKRRKKKKKSTNLARWTRITANYSSKLKIPIIRTISVKEISVKWISVKKKERKKERKKEKKNRKNKMKRQSLN